jgi:hypothetical protein
MFNRCHTTGMATSAECRSKKSFKLVLVNKTITYKILCLILNVGLFFLSLVLTSI